MIDRQAFVERYVQLWNEPDPDVRRETIARLWTPDGTNFTESLAVRGHEALEGRVRSTYERYVRSGDYLFRQATQLVGHHGAAKFSWEMVRIESGDVASVGLEFFLLEDDGRIRSDYQFIEQ